MNGLFRRVATGVAAVSVLAGCAIRFFTAGEPQPFDIDCGGTFTASYTGQANDSYVVVTVDNTGRCRIEAKTSTGDEEIDLMRIEPGKRAVAVADNPDEDQVLTVALHCAGEAADGKCRGTIRIAAARRARKGGAAMLTAFNLPRETLSTGDCGGTRELGSFTNRLEDPMPLWIRVTNTGTCNIFKVDVTVDGTPRPVEDAEGGRPTETQGTIPGGKTAVLVAGCAESTEASPDCAGAVEVTLRQ
jgi:hypothetical protein